MLKNQYQKYTFVDHLQFEENNDDRQANDIKDLCKKLHFSPKVILQVGAANSGELEYLEFINDGAKALLFEPNPEFFKDLKNRYGNHPNIALYQLGIWKVAGKFKFYEKWAGTFLSEQPKSPTEIIDNYIRNENDTFWCECANIKGFDNGNIDLLLIDAEGVEFDILTDLKSKPIIICVETHYIYKKYKHPQFDKILAWMTINNYFTLATNESDTVFVNPEFISKYSQ